MNSGGSPNMEAVEETPRVSGHHEKPGVERRSWLRQSGGHLASVRTVAASAPRAGLGLPGSCSCSATLAMITAPSSAHRSVLRLRVSVPAPGL